MTGRRGGPREGGPGRPARRDTAGGPERRVGVEIELIGLDVDTAARVVADVLPGELDVRSAYDVRIRGGAHGDWRVELDYRYLKQKGDERARTGADEEWTESLLREGVRLLVPVEVISPPLPLSALDRAQSVVEALRRVGARGTSQALHHAFGLHLNIELPSTDAACITRYLKAFLCLYDWLARRCGVDLTRRLTGFIEAFPRAYVRRVVVPEYEPDRTRLIDDYLEANPTRNRALDLLPLFAELDEPRVRAAVDDDRVQPRPALHYRLPNSEVDDPNWGVDVAWNDWLVVEWLAAQPERLAELGRRYAAFLDRGLTRWLESWADETEAWLAAERDR